jgi:hypothetical protein
MSPDEIRDLEARDIESRVLACHLMAELCERLDRIAEGLKEIAKEGSRIRVLSYQTAKPSSSSRANAHSDT